MHPVRITSPIDGSLYAERPLASDGAVEAAVSRARAAQAEWARIPVRQRVGVLQAFTRSATGSRAQSACAALARDTAASTAASVASGRSA